jgi:glutaredoxin
VKEIKQMNVCEEHEGCVVVYNWHDCPICEKAEELIEKESEIDDLKNDISTFKQIIDELKSEIETLNR